MTEDKIKEIQYPTRRHAAAAAAGNYKKVFRYWRGRLWGSNSPKICYPSKAAFEALVVAVKSLF
jgi:hypothetical protein